mmetsp:Transcript_1069/g.2129  ORF Transcript_1069/g.2129 Transcript_1069/m.2129 type:complete len:220 (-) Transcript_1069:89-748(-)
MGNSIALDFKKVKVGHLSTSHYSDDQSICSDTVVSHEPTTLIVRRDHERDSLIFFDESRMIPVFVTSFQRGRKGIESITRDGKGHAVFFTTLSPCHKTRFVYRVTTQARSDSSVDKAASSGQDLACSAEISIDRTGASTCAFLDLVVWKGSGPERNTLYKAVLIDEVKYGALVVDMEGQVVAKTYLDRHRMEPMIDIAGGGDVASVIGIVTTLQKNFSA